MTTTRDAAGRERPPATMPIAPLLLIVAVERLMSSSVPTMVPTPSAAAAGSHLKYLAMYGFVPWEQQGIVNLGTTCPTNKSDPRGLATKVEAWSRWAIPSLYDLSPHLTNDRCRRSGNCSMVDRGVCNDTFTPHGWPVGRTLNPWWQQLLQSVVQVEILPHFGKGNMYRGVFLGDELCGNAACWDTIITPLATELRKLLGPDGKTFRVPELTMSLSLPLPLSRSLTQRSLMLQQLCIPTRDPSTTRPSSPLRWIFFRLTIVSTMLLSAQSSRIPFFLTSCRPCNRRGLSRWCVLP